MANSKPRININSDHQIKTQESVLKSLQGRGKTIEEMALELKLAYSSVRLAVRVLEAEGEVKPEPGKYRNVKYFISGDPTGPNRIVPLMNSSTGAYKMWLLVDQHKVEEPVASQAIKNLPKHVVQLLNFSKRLQNDPTISTKPLMALKKRIEEDRDALQNALGFYEQLINNPKNWNPAILIRYPNDIDWPDEDIEAGYNYYFRTD